ncbi:PPE domain-containing protein, partial [Mycobacterium eburneum]
MRTGLDVDPEAVLACAAAIESVRERIHPGSLTAGFAPAAGDAVSALAATRISAAAAPAVNGVWATWSALGAVAEKLRVSATGYQRRDEESAAMLSGGGASPGSGPAAGPVLPGPAPVAVPHVYTGTPGASPEQLSLLLHSGPGPAGAEEFGQQWSSHAGQVRGAASDLVMLGNSLGSSWSGTAHDGAAAAINSAQIELLGHSESMDAVGAAAGAHAASFRRVTDPQTGVPTPSQFGVWRQNLDNALAAEQQYPGVYTPAVVAAQDELAGGYAQTGDAYSPYAIDPVTGEVIDPMTGLPVDPLTGEPLDDIGDAAEDSAGDAQEMLSGGVQMVSGLLGGGMGAVSGALGALSQGGQQLGQMASQGLGQLAKGLSSSAKPDLGEPKFPEGGNDFGGGAGGGGGGMG